MVRSLRFQDPPWSEKYDLLLYTTVFRALLYLVPRLECEKIKTLEVGLDEIMDFGWSL